MLMQRFVFYKQLLFFLNNHSSFLHGHFSYHNLKIYFYFFLNILNSKNEIVLLKTGDFVPKVLHFAKIITNLKKILDLPYKIFKNFQKYFVL